MAVPNSTQKKTATKTVSPTVAGKGASPCLVLIPNPVKNIPLIGDLISGAGVCLFTKTEARALIGGLMLAAGAGLGIVGISVLVVSAFSHTKAGQAAGKVAGTAGEVAGAGLVLAGMPEAGAAVHAAVRGPRSAARHVQSRGRQRQQGQVRASREQDAQDRHEERQYDEVMARSRDSAKGPAVRRELDEVPF
jgi:hypothetical protein